MELGADEQKHGIVYIDPKAKNNLEKGTAKPNEDVNLEGLKTAIQENSRIKE